MESSVLIVSNDIRPRQIKKVRDWGKPGSHGHVVELEFISRRRVFRMFLPFLIASLIVKVQKEDRGP